MLALVAHRIAAHVSYEAAGWGAPEPVAVTVRQSGAPAPWLAALVPRVEALLAPGFTAPDRASAARLGLAAPGAVAGAVVTLAPAGAGPEAGLAFEMAGPAVPTPLTGVLPGWFVAPAA